MEGIAGPDKTPSRIAGMFDAIAPRYDLLNRVLSAGLDRRWRDRAVDALQLRRERPRPRSLHRDRGSRGRDRSPRARRDRSSASTSPAPCSAWVSPRLPSLGLGRSIQLVRGDATRIPVGSATCDAATIAFGIRNVAEPERALAEIARVLRPNGRLAILEFGQPAIPGIRSLYSWYFRYVLPAIGRLVSKHTQRLFLPAGVGRHLSAARRNSRE